MKKVLFKKVFSVGFWLLLIVGSIYAVEELDNASPEYIETNYRKALEAFNNQNYEESLNLIRHVIKSDMMNFKLRYLAAHNHWKQLNFDAAVIHFERTLKVKPAEPGPYIDYALMELGRRRMYAARKIALNGIENLKANNVDVPSKLYNILSRIELLQHNYNGALQYAETAKSVFDNKGTGVKDKLEAVVLEARAHLAVHNYEKAEFSMLWALSIRKDSPYLNNLMGYIYMQWSQKAGLDPQLAAKHKEKAAEYFEIALKSPNLVENFRTLILENKQKLS